jgi:hypothetical protein
MISGWRPQIKRIPVPGNKKAAEAAFECIPAVIIVIGLFRWDFWSLTKRTED